MPISKPMLSKEEQDRLVSHIMKHKTYPFMYRWAKTINNTNFDVASGGSGFRNFTLTFQVREKTPIHSIAANFIVTPNTTVGTFGIALSYKSTISFADNANAGIPDDEGSEVYMLLSNGGAINDFQVFYPLNFYMDRAFPLYVHVFADTTTCTAGTSTMVGRVILGTMPTGA